MNGTILVRKSGDTRKKANFGDGYTEGALLCANTTNLLKRVKVVTLEAPFSRESASTKAIVILKTILIFSRRVSRTFSSRNPSPDIIINKNVSFAA